jgi:hypothetical protein
VQLLKNFPSILWNLKVHYRVRALHWSLSRARPIQSIPSHLISPRSILILFPHLRLGLPRGLPSGFPTNILYTFLFSPHLCYMPCPSHPRLDHSKKKMYVYRDLDYMFSTQCLLLHNQHISNLTPLTS